MLTIEEIKQFIDEDRTSKKKQLAKQGLRYYEADHDIKDYKVYYFNKDGELKEDKTKSNIKITHPFFTELVDQKAQYQLSGDEPFVKSDIPALQAELDKYFDDNFKAEFLDLITYTSAEGFSYLYRYKDENDISRFAFAEGLTIVEVQAKYASDNEDHLIYYYLEKIEKDKMITKIQVWDKQFTYYYTMQDEMIEVDGDYELNPRPHTIYEDDKGNKYYDTFGNIPFFRLDNNRKQFSDLKAIKPLIDDYDLMSCGLSNNLQDVAEGIYVVKGFEGDNLDEMIHNVKAKKHVGVGEGGDLDIKTIDIPYQARQAKLELDEKNIYRFGMGFNSSQIGDGNVTNIVIKSRYSLLDLKCNKLEMQLKKFLKKILKVVIEEINEENNAGYRVEDTYIDFKREIMSNDLDNAQIEKTDAEKRQIEINTLLNLESKLDNQTLMEQIFDLLDLDYEEYKDRLPQEEELDLNKASETLNNVVTEPIETPTTE